MDSYLALFPNMKTMSIGIRDVNSLAKSSIGLFLFGLLLLPLVSFGSIRFTNVANQFLVKGYSYFGGHGVCWIDVNNDKRLDIYVKNAGAKGVLAVKNILFINYGDYFLDEADLRGVSDAYAEGTHGAVFADLDEDEDFDLFSTTSYDGISPAHNHIYKNDGLGFFQDATSGIIPKQDIDTASRGVAVADFDGDGDVDLFFTNPLPDPLYFNPGPSPPQKLKNFYRNEGEGIFTHMYRGIDWTGFVQGVSSVDIDGDGDIDIAEAKWGAPSTIYLNDGNGNFTDVGKNIGLPQDYNVHDNGMIFADVDNDKDMDLTIVGKEKLTLYENRSNVFYKYQTISPYELFEGFHVCFGDFDHDGDLDLYLSGEDVYENDGHGIFTLISSNISGLSSSPNTVDPRGSALGDFDNDGDLDIYVTDKKGYNLLLRNEVNNSDWIQVEILTDHTAGVGGIGTKLDLYSAGHLDQPEFLKGHREIQGEYGYLGQDMPIVHFGAPASGRYDLRVAFLDGSEKIITDISPGKIIQVSKIPPPPPIPDAPVSLNVVISIISLKKSPAIVYHLSWGKNPENIGEYVKEYKIYKKENDGEFVPYSTVDKSTLSAEIRITSLDKKLQFGISTVYTYETESDIVIFGLQE